MSDENRYFEGDYEGNVIERYKQQKDDEYEEAQRALKEESTQEKLMENERARVAAGLALWYSVDGDELDRLMEEYAKEDKLCEYLVDGAILRCTEATLEDYKLFEKNDDDNNTVSLNIGTGEEDLRQQTTLRVSENPMSLNGLIYATTKDTVMYTNIFPFKCNCKISINRPSELKNILADENRNQDGVCKHLMKLSSEWENIHLDGIDYLKKADDTSPVGGVTIALDPSRIDTEGITRTSTLFCRHGGIIYPVDSGQTELRARQNAIKVLDTYLRKGVFDDLEVDLALRYLGFVSNVGVFEYGSKTGKDYNQYDDYIIGWCEYYSEVTGTFIDPVYIKAMIYVETKMGYYDKGIPTTNSTRDVMQALDIKNDNIYNYIDISITNFTADTSQYGVKTAKWIWEYNKKTGYPGDPIDELRKSCGGIVRSLFNSSEDGDGYPYTEGSSGMYHLMYENVTPIMSIGIGVNYVQYLYEKNDHNYEKTLEAYNRGNPN